MKLRNRNESPVGGFYYVDPTYGTIATTSTFNNLIRAIEDRYAGAGTTPPNDLPAIVEDQICMRQPASKCYYTKGLGDAASRMISAAAGAVDAVFGTGLKTKARKCGGCAKRRNRLNQLTS